MASPAGRRYWTASDSSGSLSGWPLRTLSAWKKANVMWSERRCSDSRCGQSCWPRGLVREQGRWGNGPHGENVVESALRDERRGRDERERGEAGPLDAERAQVERECVRARVGQECDARLDPEPV